jgi:hypothetical protein
MGIDGAVVEFSGVLGHAAEAMPAAFISVLGRSPSMRSRSSTPAKDAGLISQSSTSPSNPPDRRAAHPPGPRPSPAMPSEVAGGSDAQPGAACQRLANHDPATWTSMRAIRDRLRRIGPGDDPVRHHKAGVGGSTPSRPTKPQVRAIGLSDGRVGAPAGTARRRSGRVQALGTCRRGLRPAPMPSAA